MGPHPVVTLIVRVGRLFRGQAFIGPVLSRGVPIFQTRSRCLFVWWLLNHTRICNVFDLILPLTEVSHNIISHGGFKVMLLTDA